MPRSSPSPPVHLHRQFIHLHPSLMFLLFNILFSSFNISPSLTSKAQEAGISPARRGDANNSTQGFTFNVAMLLRFVLPPVVKPFATGVASGVLGLQAKLLVTVALRYTWGPIFGSGCPSVTDQEMAAILKKSVFVVILVEFDQYSLPSTYWPDGSLSGCSYSWVGQTQLSVGFWAQRMPWLVNNDKALIFSLYTIEQDGYC